ncbi:BTB/POZ domain-containing protein KCTD12-like [Penaeus monodon]|uniref:BTB/POZ domain-containing protein KCTD12-like n=1 Tax=Penaeus monodon TaxID=6687 RepID=UPI0018A7AF06|nr:BTB/POZ domain-containing protein KCTD12-like [Penaeus monodon]
MATNGATTNSSSSSGSSNSGQPASEQQAGSTMNSITQVFPPIVELNVGGVFYTTSLTTLQKDPESLLGQMFSGKSKTPVLRDSKGKFFVDRDGVLFRYILDYLRNQKLVLPENFSERERLKNEAEFYALQDMVESLTVPKSLSPIDPSFLVKTTCGTITVSYRGTFAFGRDGLADVKFRKLNRILVSGRVTLCREVFGDTLNESRDPDRGAVDRYSSRFFLKHTFLEQAFDMLVLAGYKCQGSCGSSTAGGMMVDKKPGMDSEEDRWNHYNEFVWVRE